MPARRPSTSNDALPPAGTFTDLPWKPIVCGWPSADWPVTRIVKNAGTPTSGGSTRLPSILKVAGTTLASSSPAPPCWLSTVPGRVAGVVAVGGVTLTVGAALVDGVLEVEPPSDPQPATVS